MTAVIQNFPSVKWEVDLNDPYHFDHPLDHVPGMALVGALLGLVRDSAAQDLGAAGHRLRLSVTFPAFCELTTPVHLRAVRAGTALTLLAEQAGRVVCAAELSLCRDPVVPPDEPVDVARRLPADPASVNRRRAENVLITGPSAHGDTRVVGLLPIRRPHPLASGPGEPHRPELLVDAARQFGTMICHLEHGRPPSTRFVILGIDADLPCRLRGPVHLRWSAVPAGRGRQRVTIEVLAGDPHGDPCGTVGFEYYAASPAGYRRLRGAVAA